MPKILLSFSVFLLSLNLFAQIPSIDNPNSLDLGTWNLEWFGDPTNGPSNKTTQYNNVKAALTAMNPDMMGFAEISDVVSFSKLIGELKEYEYTWSAFNGSQRMGLMVRSATFSISNSRDVLTQFNYEFAGRPPLEVILDVKGNKSPVDRIIVFVLHMKAFNDATSYSRRKAGAEKLKAYIDATYSNEYVVVLGDYNDDLDVSITSGKPSPYKNFVDDQTNYKFATMELTLTTDHSTASYSNMIDHILLTNEWFPYISAGKTKVMYLNKYISGYSSNTSDHYPVYTQLSFPVYTSVSDLNTEKPVSIPVLSAYPNPFNPETTIEIQNPGTTTQSLKIMDLLGREIRSFEVLPSSQKATIHWDGKTENGQSVPSGVYIAVVSGGKSLKLVLLK